MLNILYTLIIFPIEQVIEICFFYGKTWSWSLGVAIIGVSVAVSTFVLPIYLMADRQQRKQREIEKSLKKGVDIIKGNFKGDERFMLLSEYYRRKNYHPIFALRNSIDLLIQIPFFIAAYHFLHNLEILKGASFLFITDLGSPDKLLFGLNLLPIVMTVINVVSGMIYAKNLLAKDKIQLYAMAGIFLILLYNSPAGLVLYWTSNNIYNLVKNIIQNGIKSKKQELRAEGVNVKNNALNDSRTFVLALLALALLTGLVIPSGVILSGVDEFSYSTAGDCVSPLRFVIHTMLQAGGFFLWGVCLFFLFQGKARIILTVAAVSLLIMSVMDTFVYWRNYGFLTQELVLSNYYKPWPQIQNNTLAVIIGMSCAAFFLMAIRQKQIIISMLFIAVISFAAFGITNVAKINANFARVAKQEKIEGSEQRNGDFEKIFKFSRNGKNVIVLMLDRAQSQYVPYIFAEKPELLKSFQGFTYYPNMVSFGGSTMYAAQTLFGGYHYTPAEIQKRTQQRLPDKYDEGMQVLPRIMAQNGFDVVATNMPFSDENEKFAKTTSGALAKQIFDGSENIKAEDIIDKYIDRYYRGELSVNSNIKTNDYDPVVKKNLFQFSLFKCSPYAMRTKVYNNGNYMNVDAQKKNVPTNYTREMLKNYISLLSYPQMTQITDDGGNNCAIAVNDLIHAPSFLQYPDYEPVAVITNRGNGIFSNNPQYHTTALAFRLIAKWLDYLKENGIYGNARIIICSDHGYPNRNAPLNPLPYNIALPNGDVLQRFNNLLMVKDFDAASEFSTDSSFMTNADVPNIAVKNIIENPLNPFTREPLYVDKDSGVIIPTANWKSWSAHGEYKYTINGDEWLKVKENVFKKENWSKYTFEK
jgi:YidC/Oxa1 family membrane protein insertase